MIQPVLEQHWDTLSSDMARMFPFGSLTGFANAPDAFDDFVSDLASKHDLTQPEVLEMLEDLAFAGLGRSDTKKARAA